ncbi:monovalent cation/H(+) antiporter subunit G [Castellaniella sp. GW247-6E4]|uniref:monovalent cation/H(+) antiporter subunit G n=1 Tax=Castellaniella sp. GW247-6E4 TaxID=3140380 RepID=UPI0033160560
MTDMPAWIIVPAALLIVVSGLLTLIGSIGLLRLRSFNERMHAPTLGMTLGVFCMVLASMLVATTLQGRPVFHEFLISLFLIMTAPVTAILLMQSAIRRQGGRNRE